LERLEVTNLTWQRLEKIQDLLKAKGIVSQTTTTVLLGERQIPITVLHGEIPPAEYIDWSRPRREYEELTFTLTLTKPPPSPPKV
jgi:hypothetical protein